jgi:glycosidase
VNPRLGGWRQIGRIAREFILICDLVLNHMSAESRWFRGFLKGDHRFDDFFITVRPGADLSSVARPRALPLTHSFKARGGEKLLWTTFSRDQVDLNYKNPRVLLEMIRVLLLYIKRGARVIRLDAIAYLWKEEGTACIHLPRTHMVVKLFRALLDSIAPWVLLITETNVPHKENISYFGDGGDEAHMVYQFSLPPLVLHSFLTQDASALTRWAADLRFPGGGSAFFNFLASHDGIGLLPAYGLLTQAQLDALAEGTKERGGLISYKQTSQGAVPYELNISYLSAVTGPADPPALKARKFLASQAVMLAFRGVPGIYAHSLLGSENDHEGVEKTGSSRAINRRKLLLREIERELTQDGGLRRLVYEGYARLLKARSSHPAFHPQAEQRVVEADPRLFALVRGGGGVPGESGGKNGGPGVPGRESGDGNRGADAPGNEGEGSGDGTIICIHNVSSTAVDFACSVQKLGSAPGGDLRDLITGKMFPGSDVWKAGSLHLRLEPYEVLWLLPADDEV